MKVFESNIFTSVLMAAIALVFFILINQLSSRFFGRWDLTEEKRYSINEATKKQLEALPDVVNIEVYLAGELPASFKRMQRSLIETLEEFAIYANGRLVYQVIDPNTAISEQSRAEFMQSMARLGLQPTDVFINEDGNRTQKRILTGVLVSYGSRNVGVQLFKGNKAASAEERINQSIEGMEYELINAIKQITRDRRPLIGLATGHSEMDSIDLVSFRRLLMLDYRIEPMRMAQLENRQPDVLMVIQPKEAYSPLDKYHLDQFIMNGGKSIFLVDKLAVNMDSAALGTYSFPYELNIDDMLFRYGVRVNNDLVQDFVSGAYPIIVGNSGDQPQIQLLQWPFFPVINEYSNHVIVRNLDAAKANFISSIDTVKAVGIKKTVLMSSSVYSRVSTAPVYVDINILQESLAPEKFDIQNVPLGVLLEGQFQSFFKNRFLPEGADEASFVDAGNETAMVVIADGDFVKNELDPRNSTPLPVGYDPYMGQEFANGDLVVNVIEYLLAEDGLINARAKEVIIRPLDRVKVDAQRKYYQVVNIGLPLVLLVLLGVVIAILRKRKYSQF